MHISSKAFALCVSFTVIGATGCKKSEPTKPSAPVSATPAPAPAPTPPPAPKPVAAPAPTTMPAPVPAPAASNADDQAALAFFREQIEACNAWNVKVGNSKPGEKYFDGTAKDPSRAVKIVGRPAPRQALIQDADGTQLLVDLALSRITSPKGPKSELPVRYRACPEKIFVGTSD